MPQSRGAWSLLAVGAGCTLGSYGIVLWAMTLAPIGLVAALRETSIVFGALIA
jgi:drug/metabolite transporter (DMT)-like permease